MNLRATVGDEAFHAVQIPFAGLGILRGFEPHGLQVGTGIRFGQIHGAVRFTAGETRQITLTLIFIAEFTDGFGNVLQTEQVLQGCIGTGNHFRHHRVNGRREVQSAVFAGQNHTGNTGFAQVFQVFDGQRMVGYHAVGKMRTFLVNLTGTRGNPFAGNIADHGKNAFETVESIRVIFRRSVEFRRIRISVFTDGNDFFKVDIFESEAKILLVRNDLGHDEAPLRLWLYRL